MSVPQPFLQDCYRVFNQFLSLLCKVEHMFALILIVIVGLGIALFAQQNTANVPLTIGTFQFAAIPVYLVVISSLLFGLFIAWILSMMDFFSHSLSLRKKDRVIQNTEQRVATLEERIHQLETENAELRGGEHDQAHRDHSTEHDIQPPRRNFIEQMRDRFAHNRREEGGILS
jgi:uncharacterized integral membrane protein